MMWGHYADGHRGFVIEFNTDNPRFAPPNGLHQIIYSADPPMYDPSTSSNGWWKIKSKEWEYENEYRIISKIEECEKVSSNGKNIYLRHLPRICVKAVFMGLKTEAAMKKRIRDVCAPSGINVFESVFLKGGVSYGFRRV